MLPAGKVVLRHRVRVFLNLSECQEEYRPTRLESFVRRSSKEASDSNDWRSFIPSISTRRCVRRTLGLAFRFSTEKIPESSSPPQTRIPSADFYNTHRKIIDTTVDDSWLVPELTIDKDNRKIFPRSNFSPSPRKKISRFREKFAKLFRRMTATFERAKVSFLLFFFHFLRSSSY